MNSESEQVSFDYSCLRDAQNLMIFATAIALALSEGKSWEELNILSTFLDAVAVQLNIISNYCQPEI
jgi:hypothetical protein